MILILTPEKNFLPPALKPMPDPAVEVSPEQIALVLNHAYGHDATYTINVTIENNSVALQSHPFTAEMNLILLALWQIGNELDVFPDAWLNSPLWNLFRRLLYTPEHMFECDTAQGQIETKKDLKQIKKDLEEILVLFAYKITGGNEEQIKSLCDFNRTPANSLATLKNAITKLSRDNSYELNLTKKLFWELCSQAEMCTDGLKTALTMIKADLKEKDLHRIVADYLFNIIIDTRKIILAQYSLQNDQFATWICAHDVHLLNFLVKHAAKLGYDLKHSMPLETVEDRYDPYITNNFDVNFLYLLERNLSANFTLAKFIENREQLVKQEISKIFNTLGIQTDPDGYCLCTDFETVEVEILRLLKRVGIISRSTTEIGQSLVNFRDEIVDDIQTIEVIYDEPEKGKVLFDINTPLLTYKVVMKIDEAKHKFNFLSADEIFTAGDNFEQLKFSLASLVRKKKITNIEYNVIRTLAAAGLCIDMTTVHANRSLRLHLANFNTGPTRRLMVIENQGVTFTLDNSHDNFLAKFEIIKQIIENDPNQMCLPLILLLFAGMGDEYALPMLTQIRAIPTAANCTEAWEMLYDVAPAYTNSVLRFLVDHGVDPTQPNYIPLNIVTAYANAARREYNRNVAKVFSKKTTAFWQKCINIIYKHFPNLCPINQDSAIAFEEEIHGLNSSELVHLYYGLVKIKPLDCTNVDHTPWVRETIFTALLNVLNSKPADFLDNDTRIIDFLFEPDIFDIIVTNKKNDEPNKLQLLLNLGKYPAVASKIKAKILTEAATANHGAISICLILALALYDIQQLASYQIDFFELENEKILFNEIRTHVIRQQPKTFKSGFAALTLILLYCVDHNEVDNAIDHLFLEIDPSRDPQCLAFTPLNSPDPFKILADQGFEDSIPQLIECAFKSEMYKKKCLSNNILHSITNDNYMQIAAQLIRQANIAGRQISLLAVPNRETQADALINRFWYLARGLCVGITASDAKNIIINFFNVLNEQDYKFIIRRLTSNTDAYRELVSWEVFTALNMRTYPGIYDDIRAVNHQIKWAERKRLSVAERLLESSLETHRSPPSSRPSSASSDSAAGESKASNSAFKRFRQG